MDKIIKALKNELESYEKIGIAFSGGVDSTLLLKASIEILGADRVVAYTVKSPYIPQWEYEEAIEAAKDMGVTHRMIQSGIPESIVHNPENRCYLCKSIVFGEIIKAAKVDGCTAVCDGTNADDLLDYRPGLVALSELGVISPLKDAGMTKQQIRDLSKAYGLKTWDKPPYACLLTRIPYGVTVDFKMLIQIEKAEEILMNEGIRGVRVRHHGEIARIEIRQEEMHKILDLELMNKIHAQIRQLGFKFVSLDLGGYQTGCYNAGLKSEK